ncbi:MAG: cation diffusion facilitator family transporter [Ignavibacteriae bacterium]|nr:cation diffusion facilitator family transporter [Ignavibacteriota bacterium]
MKSAEEHAAADALMRREKNFVAMTSVIAAIALTGGKLAVGLMTNSLGILSEAAHSGLDLVAAAITWIAVRAADRPPDEDHNFGHGKIENLSALVETLLLLLTCVWILYEAADRLLGGGHPVEVTYWSFIVIIVSIVIDFSRSRALSRVARKYHSQALEADALHFQTDIYSSFVVLIGLVSVLLGYPAADAIAALLVAAIVIWISLQLGKRTIDVLLDRVPAGMQATLTDGIRGVDGVRDVRSLRLRQSGARTFIDTVVGIDRRNTFDDVHRIMDDVEARIAELVPRSDAIVHAEPAIHENEAVQDSVAWLVQRHGVRAHNILVLRADERLHIELDVEYPFGTDFDKAHALASVIERDILEAIPRVEDVRVHLEMEAGGIIEADDITGAEPDLVGKITAVAKADTEVLGCSDIRCYRTHRGIKVALSCVCPSALSLQHMHDVVNRVETAVSACDPRIVKVFIHAEPGQS